MWYQIFVLTNGNWELAKEGRMSKSAAFGLLNQFAQQYPTRLFRGYEIGKFVAEKSPA